MNRIKEMEINFPVKSLSTTLNMNDLVLNSKTHAGVEELKELIISHKQLIENNTLTQTRVSGLHAIFAGPSGTGKTISATVLARELGLDVYRIDLSEVVSKYIGETEKNLQKLFSAAESACAILFFDEADALFGKRTEVRDSHDKYANQEVSYLLQQIEGYRGILILAFNRQLNSEVPFLKRFSIIVEFEKPDAGERLRLWRKYLPYPIQQEMELGITGLAQKYKLTGGEIVRSIRQAMINRKQPVSKDDLIKAVRKEAEKQDNVEE
jgi:SpoVK/Ycf46/Vps4 family AAA+-type ATPase